MFDGQIVLGGCGLMVDVQYDRGLPGMYMVVRRAADVAVSAALFVLLSPVLLVAAILIKLTSPGPLFFTQDRSGRDEKLFRVYKFRTMRAGRQPDPEELVPLNHPEITWIGRILRRTKIDELPQLLNVLRGEMSLIGPRPTLPEQVAKYTPFQRQRLRVRPGITGLAQVNGNTAIPWAERIKYDVHYVHHVSFGIDAAILLRSIWTIVVGEGRYARPFAQSSYARKG